MRDRTLIGPWIRRFLLEHLVSDRNFRRLESGHANHVGRSKWCFTNIATGELRQARSRNNGYAFLRTDHNRKVRKSRTIHLSEEGQNS
jgi:hypothetical protein